MSFGDLLRYLVEGIVTLVVLDQLLLAAARRGWLRWRGVGGDD